MYRALTKKDNRFFIRSAFENCLHMDDDDNRLCFRIRKIILKEGLSSPQNGPVKKSIKISINKTLLAKAE